MNIKEKTQWFSIIVAHYFRPVMYKYLSPYCCAQLSGFKDQEAFQSGGTIFSCRQMFLMLAKKVFATRTQLAPVSNDNIPVMCDSLAIFFNMPYLSYVCRNSKACCLC